MTSRRDDSLNCERIALRKIRSAGVLQLELGGERVHQAGALVLRGGAGSVQDVREKAVRSALGLKEASGGGKEEGEGRAGFAVGVSVSVPLNRSIGAEGEATHKVGFARKVAKNEGHAVEVKLLPRVELQAVKKSVRSESFEISAARLDVLERFWQVVARRNRRAG